MNEGVTHKATTALELAVMGGCANELERLDKDRDALRRVLRYLYDRFTPDRPFDR
jgi:hypothetical protein